MKTYIPATQRGISIKSRIRAGKVTMQDFHFV
jgi:hypothetical protein